MDIHSCINFILSNTQNAVNNYFKRELQEYDITPSQRFCSASARKTA